MADRKKTRELLGYSLHEKGTDPIMGMQSFHETKREGMATLDKSQRAENLNKIAESNPDSGFAKHMGKVSGKMAEAEDRTREFLKESGRKIMNETSQERMRRKAHQGSYGERAEKANVKLAMEDENRSNAPRKRSTWRS